MKSGLIGTKKLAMLLLTLFTLGSANYIDGPLYGPTNDTWNYANGGADWNATAYPYCALAQYVQAPISITNIGANNTGNFTWYVAYEW